MPSIFETEKELADAERLRQAESDAAAFRAEVSSVIESQQMQISVLERQAQQLANEAAAEQRYSSALLANDKSSMLARAQREHGALSLSLEQEGRRALNLASRLDAADTGMRELRDRVTRLDSARLELSKVRTGPMAAKTRRALSASDDATAAAGKLREEIDSLRKERLVFLTKMRDIELQLSEQQAVNAECEGGIRIAASRRESALSHARHIEGAAERRSRMRTVQRQQMESQLQAVEVQARQARARMREKMAASSNAATSGAAALHKARIAHHAWPPSIDRDGLLAQLPQPRSLPETVEVLAAILGCAPDLEAICEQLSAEEREQAERMNALELQRRELGATEERNERMRRELLTLESTGGGDSAEHHTLREQLTEMQAQVHPQTRIDRASLMTRLLTES